MAVTQEDLKKSLEEKKRNAEVFWDKVFNKALNGDINKYSIVSAMMLLNTADTEFCEIKHLVKIYPISGDLNYG